MKRRTLLALSLSGLLTGCATGQLTFLTYTKVGLDVSTTEQQPTAAVFGYKRFEGAIIPVDKTDEEAASVYASIDLENHWLCGLDVVQLFATGKAAENVAANTSKAAKTFQDTLKMKQVERSQQEWSCLRNITQKTPEAPAAAAAGAGEE